VVNIRVDLAKQLNATASAGDVTYKPLLNDEIWAADYGLKSRIPGEYMAIKSSLF